MILIRGTKNFGTVGTPTNLKDINDEKLFVGDAVEIIRPNGTAVSQFSVVCKDESLPSEAPFIMGIQGSCTNNGIDDGWGVRKVGSYKNLKDGMTTPRGFVTSGSLLVNKE